MSGKPTFPYPLVSANRNPSRRGFKFAATYGALLKQADKQEPTNQESAQNRDKFGSMETQINRRSGLASLVLSVFLLFASSTSEQDLSAEVPQGDNTVVGKQLTWMGGHVLARVEHSTGWLINSLGGQRYEVFIFGIDKWEKEAGWSAAPVKVVYEFYRDEPNLPEKFFDFSSRYKLTVVRDTKCDESVKSLSFEANVSDSGKPLAATYVLKVLDGAPTDVLKPDLILPCFVLRPGQYKVISKGETL